MVERALPSAWASASPTAVMAARHAGLEALFTRIDGDDGALVGALAPALDLLDRAADGAPLLGRPLAAAWAARRRAVLDGPVGPSVALRAWLAATVLREQRGDAHVAAAAAVGLDGCELHLTLAGTGRVPGELLRDARGWSAEEWQEASDRLVVRGLLRPDGGLTSDGLATRVALEDATDRASAQAWGVLADEERTQVLLALRPLGALVVDASRSACPTRWAGSRLPVVRSGRALGRPGRTTGRMAPT